MFHHFQTFLSSVRTLPHSFDLSAFLQNPLEIQRKPPASSSLSRNKAKTLDAKLARATKWVGAIFLILTLVLLILQG